MTDFEEDINACVRVMRQGRIVLYPTDTVWGIGCDATNDEAVEKIYALKRRRESKACISLVDSIATLERYVEVLPEAAEMLIDVAVEPLTIIYDSPRGISSELKAADGSAAFRISQERFSRELCRRLRKPVVSTSANISGSAAPAFFDEIAQEIIEGVDYAVKYRRDDMTPHKPSGIIKVGNNGVIKIIR